MMDENENENRLRAIEAAAKAEREASDALHDAERERIVAMRSHDHDERVAAARVVERAQDALVEARIALDSALGKGGE